MLRPPPVYHAASAPATCTCTPSRATALYLTCPFRCTRSFRSTAHVRDADRNALRVYSLVSPPTPFFVFPPCVQYFVVVTRQTTKLQRVKRADEKRLRKKNPGKGAVTHILNILNSHSGAMGRYLASSSRLNSARPPATCAHSGTVRGRGPHRLDGRPLAQTHQQGCSTARQRADSAGLRCWALWAMVCVHEKARREGEGARGGRRRAGRAKAGGEGEGA